MVWFDLMHFGGCFNYDAINVSEVLVATCEHDRIAACNSNMENNKLCIIGLFSELHQIKGIVRVTWIT